MSHGLKRTFDYDKFIDYNAPQYVPGLFTPEECEQIIEFLRIQEFSAGTIYSTDGDGSDFSLKVDPSIRYAQNMIFPEEFYVETDWVRQRIFDASREVNKQCYEFNLANDKYDRLVACHYGVGGHFSHHVDNIGTYNGLFKKLTCVVQLSDPDSYEGGELTCVGYGPQPREQGTMILFPSYLQHAVRMITKGERFVLLNWCVSTTQFQ